MLLRCLQCFLSWPTGTLRDVAVPSRAALIQCVGGAVEAATGQGEKHRGVESPHL